MIRQDCNPSSILMLIIKHYIKILPHLSVGKFLRQNEQRSFMYLKMYLVVIM